MYKNSILFAPISAILLSVILLLNQVPQAAAFTAGITLLTAWWWSTEAIPIPATSLLCFASLAFFDVLTQQQAAAGLGSHVILLMLGGFIMAKALQASNAHQQFAVLVLRLVGSDSEKKLLFAFMLSAALLSMWISNTATCLMLMPIALATIQKLNNPKVFMPFILGIAYACSIGGMATLIGTPPNVIFAGLYQEHIGEEFGFLRWLKIGFPIMLCILPIAWFWLSRHLSSKSTSALSVNPPVWDSAQKRVLLVFVFVVLLWVFRKEPFGGWSAWFSFTNFSLAKVGDSSIALFGAALMFIIRAPNKKPLLSWSEAVKIPWGVLIMFGAGISLAKAFQTSGLADILAHLLQDAITGVPIFVLLLGLCFLVIFLTEINSNIATTTLILPILVVTAKVIQVDPIILMIPATLCASCAFMLPVATAPNAVAYATEKITVQQMIKEGFTLNIVLALCISTLCYGFLVW